MERFKKIVRFFVPEWIVQKLLPLYHYTLALAGAVLYRFPSRTLTVIGITGTKGKSSVAEMLNAIFEHAGYTTALSSTIRFKIGADSKANKYKMTMPGRFFMQSFLRKAVRKKCAVAILEMTSEGVKQSRHRFLNLDALIFTNLAPEHIESHGSFEKYRDAKYLIGKVALEKSSKRPRTIVANADDEHATEFLTLNVERAIPFSLGETQEWQSDESGTEVVFDGVRIRSNLSGAFTARNMLAAASCAAAFGVPTQTIREGLESCTLIPGRVEHINAGQSFDVVVDYAHTIDSLEALYGAFPNKRKICVLGNTGGGRDTWKRPEMAKVAEAHCEYVILTDEDPYDEDPEKIVSEMAAGMQKKEPEVIMDRRLAIRRAITLANLGKGDTVLITGKGTDPFIMRASGAREEWSDARVAREELSRIIQT